LRGRFEPGDAARIGLRGTARVSGDWAILVAYLFRRPIARCANGRACNQRRHTGGGSSKSLVVAKPPIVLPPLREELRLLPAAANHDGSPAWMVQDQLTIVFRIGWIDFEILLRWSQRSAKRCKSPSMTKPR
jgi:hypothetical protein